MLRRRLNMGRDPQPADSTDLKMRIPESLGILGTPGIPHTSMDMGIPWNCAKNLESDFSP